VFAPGFVLIQLSFLSNWKMDSIRFNFLLFHKIKLTQHLFNLPIVILTPPPTKQYPDPGRHN